MAWFDRQKPDLPQVEEEKYSIDIVRELLEQVGLARLYVDNPRIKVALTRISQEGEGCLSKRGSNGPPAGAEVATFQKQLETLLRVINEYIAIQNSPDDYEDAREFLKRGQQSVQVFARQLFKSGTSASKKAGLTNFKVDTQILSAQQHL